MYKILIINLIVIFFVKTTCAQQDSLTDKIQKTNINKGINKLPNLSALIDTALLYSPILKQQESLINIRNIEYKQSKTLWLDKIHVYSDIKYGSVDNVFLTNDGVVDNTNISTRYAVGSTLKFSIFDFLDNKRQTLIAQEKLNIDKARYNELIGVTRRVVISQYSELQLSSKLLEIQADVHETQQVQLQIGEKQFLEAIINVSEYTKIVETAAKAAVGYETAKFRYTEAYMLLGEIVGKKLNEF